MTIGQTEDLTEFIVSVKSDSEILIFEFSLDCIYETHRPGLVIKIDDEEIVPVLSLGQNHLSFSQNLSFGSHCLQITKQGSTINDPKQMIILRTLRIDGIDCQNLVWNSGEFRPIYPEPWATQQTNLGIKLENKIIGETHFGHDGTWSLHFVSPFYQYLIDRAER